MFNREKKITRQNWVSATFLLIISSVISKAFGFVREVLVAGKFGVSSQVDAYLVALSVPSLIGNSIGSAFSVAVVPLYHRLMNSGSQKKAENFMKAIFSFTTVLSLLLMLVIFLMPETIIKLIAPSLPAATMLMAKEILKWLLVLLIGFSLFNVLSAVYNALHHFKIPAITDMFSNLFIIAALLFLSSAWGIYALVAGITVSTYFVIFVFLIHLFFHRIIGFNFNFKSPEFYDFLKFVGPVLVFMFFMQLSGMIENYFASSLKGGSIASLGYAKRLYDIIPTLLIANIARAVFPTFSTLYVEKKTDELRDLVIKLNRQFIVYFFPVTVSVIFFRREIISIVFMRGAFDKTALELTSNAFMFYTLGLIATTLVPVFFRLCYAFSDSISPLLAVASSTASMIVFNYFLAPRFGISGIAAANSISVFITLFVLGMLVRKKLGGIKLKPLLKSFAISAMCTAVALAPFFYLKISSPYSAIFLMPLFFILYLALGLLVSKQEFGQVWVALKRTVVRKKLVNHKNKF
jgi:putative peptidoglycan lipid II flippase